MRGRWVVLALVCGLVLALSPVGGVGAAYGPNLITPACLSAGSGTDPAHPAGDAGDSDYSTGWWASAPNWLRCDFGVSRTIVSMRIGGGSSGCPNSCAPKTGTLDGSNDGSSWTTVYTLPTQTTWTFPTLREYTFSNSTAYRYYRLNVTAVMLAGSSLRVFEWGLSEAYVSATNTPTSYPTYTPYPTNTPYATYTPYATNTPYETYTPYPTYTPVITDTPGLTLTPTDTPVMTDTPSGATSTPFVITNTPGPTSTYDPTTVWSLIPTMIIMITPTPSGPTPTPTLTPTPTAAPWAVDPTAWGGMGTNPFWAYYAVTIFGVFVLLYMLMYLFDKSQFFLLITVLFLAAAWLVQSYQAAGIVIVLYIIFGLVVLPLIKWFGSMFGSSGG